MASSLKSFLTKLRKQHIIETLAAFIAGGSFVFVAWADRSDKTSSSDYEMDVYSDMIEIK